MDCDYLVTEMVDYLGFATIWMVSMYLASSLGVHYSKIKSLHFQFVPEDPVLIGPLLDEQEPSVAEL